MVSQMQWSGLFVEYSTTTKTVVHLNLILKVYYQLVAAKTDFCGVGIKIVWYGIESNIEIIHVI